MEFWQLPGPAAFARALADAVMEGNNVVVASPTRTGATIARMVDAHDGWGLGDTCLCIASGMPPIDDLFDAFEINERTPGKRTIASLIASLERSCRVIVSGLSLEWVTMWTKFINEYASASRSVGKFERTQIIILVSGVPKSLLPAQAPALEVLVWDGWVGEADVLGYIASVWRTEGRTVDAASRLAARIIIRLALWDFDMVDRLLPLSPAQLLAPQALLYTIASEDAAGLGRSWEAGGVGLFDGEESVHSLVLAAEGDAEDELPMRLWSAQAAELLPILEKRRRRLIDRMRDVPQPQHMVLDGEVITDLDDVELGGLTHLARIHRFPRSIVDEANSLRWLRNRLSHLCPVTLDEAQILFETLR